MYNKRILSSLMVCAMLANGLSYALAADNDVNRAGSTWQTNATLSVEGSEDNSNKIPVTHNVVVIWRSNGITTSSVDSAQPGVAVTITAKPKSGYELTDLVVTDINGNNLAVEDKSNNRYSFIMPDSDVSVMANYDWVEVEEEYRVKVSKTSGGKLVVSSDSAFKGEVITITAIPDAGYIIKEMSAENSKGTEIPLTEKSEGKYTFKMPDYDVAVKCSFEEKEKFHSIKVTQRSEGIADLSSKSGKKGEKIKVTVTPFLGHVDAGIIVMDSDGNRINVTRQPYDLTSYYFEMPDSDVTVTPMFVVKVATSNNSQENLNEKDNKTDNKDEINKVQEKPEDENINKGDNPINQIDNKEENVSNGDIADSTEKNVSNNNSGDSPDDKKTNETNGKKDFVPVCPAGTTCVEPNNSNTCSNGTCPNTVVSSNSSKPPSSTQSSSQAANVPSSGSALNSKDLTVSNNASSSSKTSSKTSQITVVDETTNLGSTQNTANNNASNTNDTATPPKGNEVLGEVPKADVPGVRVLSVFVPLDLPIRISKNGDVIAPTSAAIKSNVIKGDIVVEEINVKLSPDWEPIGGDKSAKNKNVKQMSLSLRNDALDRYGRLKPTSKNWVVKPTQSMSLNMKAGLPEKVQIDSQGIAQIEFIFGWAET